MRSFINPGIMFPARFAATASGGDFSFILTPRPNTHAHTVTPFRGVTRRWRQYSSAQFPILEKTLFKRPHYFFSSSLSRQVGEEGAVQLVLRRARPISIWQSCVWSVNLMDPTIPSGLFMQERVSSNRYCQSYNIFLLKNKIFRNIFSSTLQMNNFKVGELRHNIYYVFI